MLRANAVVAPDIGAASGRVRIQAADIGLDAKLDELPVDDPLGLTIRLVLSELGITNPPPFSIRVNSSIPVAAGMGSGAAVAVAMIRATAAFFGKRLPLERVSALAYEVEKLHHGTPSGIDNSVVSYEKPIYYQRGQPVQVLRVAQSFTVMVGDTGVSSPTAQAVGDVRRAWSAQPQYYENLFSRVGEISRAARRIIESGKPQKLGALMDENHALLQQMGVSSPELDRLVDAARQAGAWGAKLSGGGRGGNMIALVSPQMGPLVVQALRSQGAVRAILTEIRQAQEGEIAGF
jgi:mevalonate kinase